VIIQSLTEELMMIIRSSFFDVFYLSEKWCHPQMYR